MAMEEFCHLKQGTISCSEACTDPLAGNNTHNWGHGLAHGQHSPIFFSCIFFLVVFIFFLSKGSDVIPAAAIIDFIYFSGNIFEV